MPAIAPSQEAVEAIVSWINSGTYATAFEAEIAEFAVINLEDSENLRVQVIHEEEEQLAEQLGDDNTRHRISVQITARTRPGDTDAVASAKKLRDDIADRLDQWDSDDGRVQVWFVNREAVPVEIRQALREMNLFRSSVLLTVEVPPGA